MDMDALWDLSERARMYVNKRTRVLSGRTGARARKTRGERKTCGARKHAIRG